MSSRKYAIHYSRYSKPYEEIQPGDVNRCYWHPRNSKRVHEPEDIGQDAAAIAQIRAPRPAVPVVVRRGLLTAVQTLQLQVFFPHNVVIADDDAGDAGEEDRVCGQVYGELA